MLTPCRTAQVCFGFTASQMSKQDAENLQDFMEQSVEFLRTKNVKVFVKMDNLDRMFEHEINQLNLALKCEKSPRKIQTC